MMQSINIKIGGAAGAGIKSTGIAIAKTLNRLGLKVFEYAEYPSLIRGGHNSEQVFASDTAAYCQSGPVDILLALNRETIDLHLSELKAGGSIIFDSNVTKISGTANPKFHWLDVPLLEIARRNGNDIMQNNVGLGAIDALLQIPLDVPNSMVMDEFKDKKKEITDANLLSLKAGYDYVREHFPNITFHKIIFGPAKETYLVNGCEAISMGAIAAGLGLYVAYPMTPASPILQFLAEHQQEFGYVVKQPEDEIAAANMVIGAMHVGVRAMCGTSGGGFALMNETLALSGITETPFVVILAQRPGPATGLPTFTEQGELQYAIRAAHGEFPRIVLAPGDTVEAFQMAGEALNLAERYQTPVIILTDKFLGESSMSTPSLSQIPITIDRGAVLSQEDVSKNPDYRRYSVTDTGISPRSLPGMKDGVFVANSDEHEEHGLVDETSAMRVQQMDKRLKKGTIAAASMPGPEIIGPKDATVTLMTWGSMKLPAMQAMMIGNREQETGNNVGINIMHFSYMWPINLALVGKALQEVSNHQTIMLENNATGQFQSLLKEHFNFTPTAFLRRYDGRPMYAEEILKKIEEVNGKQ